MGSMINDARLTSTTGTAEQTEESEGMRLARYRALDEVPGLIFGVMTVAWIVLSFAKLSL
jgi:hypothetical protein